MARRMARRWALVALPLAFVLGPAWDVPLEAPAAAALLALSGQAVRWQRRLQLKEELLRLVATTRRGADRGRNEEIEALWARRAWDFGVSGRF